MPVATAFALGLFSPEHTPDHESRNPKTGWHPTETGVHAPEQRLRQHGAPLHLSKVASQSSGNDEQVPEQ